MAINPPNFQKDAIPTPQGWRHPRTNELLISGKITNEQIDEYYGVPAEPQMLKEAPTTFHETVREHMTSDTLPSEYESMSKDDLEIEGREIGIELDKRHSKDDLIDELMDHKAGGNIESMTKIELEAVGREHGIELDRRKSKKDLIQELKEVL